MAMARLAVVLPLLLMASCCMARDFYVGGRDGWTAKPSEPFNRWAERNRFQVNDRLVFRYRKEEDSVLVVSQSHYDACNSTEPFLRLDGGDSVFVLSHSGPFFFISGDAQRCEYGERLIAVVLAVRRKDNTPVPPPASPTPSPPAPSAPPVRAPAPRALPPPSVSPPANSSSSLSPPGTTGTSSPPSSSTSTSAASVLRDGVVACLVLGGAIILV